MQVVSWRNGGAAQDGFKTLVLTVAPPETEACTTLRRALSCRHSRRHRGSRPTKSRLCSHLRGSPGGSPATPAGRPLAGPSRFEGRQGSAGPVAHLHDARAGKNPRSEARPAQDPSTAMQRACVRAALDGHCRGHSFRHLLDGLVQREGREVHHLVRLPRYPLPHHVPRLPRLPHATHAITTRAHTASVTRS